MKLVIFGATRGIGFQVMEQALEAGHQVTAVGRHVNRLKRSHSHLTILPGSITDPALVNQAVQGQEGVCIAIGRTPTFKPVSCFSEGAATVIKAMKQEALCKSLICVTGIGAGDSKGHGGFFYDWILNPLLLKSIYADKDRQEALVRATSLKWVIVRPGFLTNGARTGKYQALTRLAGVTAGKISRADAADFILKEFLHMRHLGQTPLLTY